MNNFIKIILIALIISPLLMGNAFAADQLIFAIDVIRHGDRTPIHISEKINQHWSEGLGELTPLGLRQEYLLGQQFHRLYMDQYHLLSKQYDEKTIYVRSSDYDRTLMSAEAVLLGLYPLGSGPYLSKNESALPAGFQPVPIHTVPIAEDSLLVPDHHVDSLKTKWLLARYILLNTEWRNQTALLKPKFKEWSQLTGFPIKDLFQLISAADTVFILKMHHLPMPQGLTEAEADSIIKYGHQALLLIYKQLQIGQSAGYDLLAAITTYLNQADLQQTSLRYVLYSAHDSTLLGLMSALKVPLTETPPYSSDLKFLLFKNQHRTYLKIVYNGKSVNLPVCHQKDCSLSDFLKEYAK